MPPSPGTAKEYLNLRMSNPAPTEWVPAFAGMTAERWRTEKRRAGMTMKRRPAGLPVARPHAEHR